MPRTTPSRIRRLRAIVSKSTSSVTSGAKALFVAACSDGLKPVPPKRAENKSPMEAVGSAGLAFAELGRVGFWFVGLTYGAIGFGAMGFGAMGFGGPGFSPAKLGFCSGALAPETSEEIGPKRSESRTAIGLAPIVKM